MLPVHENERIADYFVKPLNTRPAEIKGDIELRRSNDTFLAGQAVGVNLQTPDYLFYHSCGHSPNIAGAGRSAKGRSLGENLPTV